MKTRSTKFCVSPAAIPAISLWRAAAGAIFTVGPEMQTPDLGWDGKKQVGVQTRYSLARGPALSAPAHASKWEQTSQDNVEIGYNYAANEISQNLTEIWENPDRKLKKPKCLGDEIFCHQIS